VSRGRWLAARLGLDGNSLRRRTDKIAAYRALVLLALFLAGSPVLAFCAGHWAYQVNTSEQQDQRSWHEVTAVLLQAAPIEPGSYDMSDSPTLARWTPPARQPREGEISVPAGTRAGSRVRIWIDGSGRWAGLPLSPRVAVVRVAAAVVTATLMLAAVLAAVASAGQWLLDRRRLGSWETDWNCVGPQWTRQFRALG
jgi:hypothetical protein